MTTREPCPNHPDRLVFGDTGVCLRCHRNDVEGSGALDDKRRAETEQLARVPRDELVKLARKSKVRVAATDSPADIAANMTGVRPKG